jgi:membrane protein DedA with SNARE-associated domain
MKDFMDLFLEFLESLPDFLIYALLTVSAFVENLFPPIPGDTITAFGAFLVGVGRLGFFGVYISTTFGSLLGFMCLFWIGGRLGRRFFMEKDYRFFRANDIQRAEAWFGKYGYFLVLVNRFLPGVRSAISLAGGISRLKAGKVAVLALLSCGTWNLIWILFGYFLGSHWDTVHARMSSIMAKYNITVLILFTLVVLVVIIRKKCFSGRPKGSKRPVN